MTFKYQKRLFTFIFFTASIAKTGGYVSAVDDDVLFKIIT